MVDSLPSHTTQPCSLPRRPCALNLWASSGYRAPIIPRSSCCCCSLGHWDLLVPVPQLAAGCGSVQPSGGADAGGNICGLEDILEAEHPVPAWPLELALVHGVPRDQVHMGRHVVALYQLCQLRRLFLRIVYAVQQGVLETDPATRALEVFLCISHEGIDGIGASAGDDCFPNGLRRSVQADCQRALGVVGGELLQSVGHAHCRYRYVPCPDLKHIVDELLGGHHR
mmetsp:Transcript_6075/g.16917  ORF Transcript_6075/g.16917 Transcript_6075/m.16917 type:complete len:226 (-) Transcript_6075:942-1619(-)